MTLLFATAPRILGFTGRREIAVVVLAGAAMVFALGHHYASQRHPGSPAEQGWVGALAATPAAEAPQVQPMSSSSLVVPNATLALPPVAKPILRAKSTCDSADRTCVMRSTIPLVPPKRQTASLDGQTRGSSTAHVANQTASAAEPATKTEGVSLNPLHYMPDMSLIGRPFTAAGAVVTGWAKRL